MEHSVSYSLHYGIDITNILKKVGKDEYTINGIKYVKDMFNLCHEETCDTTGYYFTKSFYYMTCEIYNNDDYYNGLYGEFTVGERLFEPLELYKCVLMKKDTSKLINDSNSEELKRFCEYYNIDYKPLVIFTFKCK